MPETSDGGQPRKRTLLLIAVYETPWPSKPRRKQTLINIQTL